MLYFWVANPSFPSLDWNLQPIDQFPGKWYLIIDPNSLIYIPYPRVNCLKTIPFTVVHTYINIAHMWQYPSWCGITGWSELFLWITVEPGFTTTSFIWLYSFNPDIKNTESFVYFENPINVTTLLFQTGFYGPTMVSLMGSTVLLC